MKSIATAFLLLLAAAMPSPLPAQSANTDEALAFGQKVTLQEALEKAKAFAEKSRPYWIPYIASEAEIQVREHHHGQPNCWVITLTSVKKESWRRSVEVRVYADGSMDEIPRK